MDYRKNPSYVERRKTLIKHFLATTLLENAFKDRYKLNVTYFVSDREIPFGKLKRHISKKIIEGERWNDTPFKFGYFHLKGKIDKDAKLDNLYLHFDAGSEGLLLDNDGNPIKGFALGKYSLEDEREYATLKCHYPLQKLVKNGNEINLWVECQDNIYLRERYPHAGIFHKAGIVEKSPEDLDVLYDYEVLSDYLFSSSNDAPYFEDVLAGLEKVRDLYMFSWPNKAAEAKKITSSLLKTISKSDFTLYCLGHSHLDLAWLWNFKETKKKALRTITNSLYLLDTYPNYKYSISQPWQLEQIKNSYPMIFGRIVELEKEGKIELLGGAYVENDLNLVGEESLIRQMLYGQKFYLENFNHYTQIGFYPDDFGFPPCLPSLLRDTNQIYFYTAKMRMNEQTIFPYSSFVYEGMDGKEVLAHLSMNPYGYNGYALPSEMVATEKRSKERSPIKTALYLYGCGDGGGGGSLDMEERISRMNHVLNLPAIRQDNAKSFFENLSFYKASLPHYSGEVYLENHQGTFTSQARNKKWNRYFEERLRALEFCLAENGITNYDDKLNEIWKEVLLYQFHDVLPGSSIKEVYEYTGQRYLELDEKIDVLLEKITNNNYLKNYKKGCYIRNFSLAHKHYEKVGNAYYIYSLPAYGEVNKYTKYKGRNVSSLTELDTKYLKIKFNPDGSFASIVDNETGKKYVERFANAFRVFYEPGDPKYANWNILENYRNQPEIYMDLVERKIKRFGPCYEINDMYSFKNSFLYQKILIDDESRLISIHHKVDWHDDNYLLKAVFHVKNMPDEVVSDTQFGFQKHSTKNDSLKDKAQYELCAYKWVDLSDKDGGIAVINKTRNGFYAKDGVLELSLLKTNSFPCKHMDQEPFEYDYALYLHDKCLSGSDVDEVANSFNAPVFYFKNRENPKNTFRIIDDDIAVSAFKNAYSGKGNIVRLYNRTDQPVTITFSLPASYSEAILCNALEDPIEPLDPNKISFRPFEIKTILLK